MQFTPLKCAKNIFLPPIFFFEKFSLWKIIPPPIQPPTWTRMFGWVPFAETFAEYLKLPKTLNPNTDEGKYSTWAKLMSLKTGHNLIPYFQWWAWPINQEAIYATKHLPDWDMVEKLKDKKCRSQLKKLRNNPPNYLAFFNFFYFQCWMNGCRVNLIKLALLMLVSQPKKVKKNVPNVSSPSSSKGTLMINVPQLLPPNFGVQL